MLEDNYNLRASSMRLDILLNPSFQRIIQIIELCCFINVLINKQVNDIIKYSNFNVDLLKSQP
uniref:Uncharacterized protein n=1 Tax=Schistosoma haematobium TaxID=6185 RepID=A0A094ZI77_SCHHA